MNEIQTTVQGYAISANGPIVPKTVQAMRTLAIWRASHADSPDYWLRAVICKAFDRMIPLRMQDAPAADLIEFVAEHWIETIGEGMNQEQDLERIVAGFRLIFRECSRWPQPSDLLNRLPRRSKPAMDKKTIEAPISDEQYAKNAAEFQKILDSLK